MMAVDEKHTSAKPAGTSQPLDLRPLIPEVGLREFWYPALRDEEVGGKKPVNRQLLGDDLCFFRGASNQVVALSNVCPHRGAYLARGECAYKGTVTCFYHGFTFNERGECVAAIGEGPESPMPGQITAKVYPTVTLKGVVFVWMGRGEPKPHEQCIPEEFFDPDALVLNWSSVWPCNWRPSLENAGDSHFRYLHRNAVRNLMKPLAPPHFPNKGRPQRIGTHRLKAVGQSDTAPAGMGSWGAKKQERPPYQHYYPGLGAVWPHHRRRLMWTWMFTWAERNRAKHHYPLSDEWGPGQHLPSLFRQNYWTHIFTRWAVPIDAQRTRQFYFHATKPANALGRLYERLHFRFIHNWLVNQNFSEQDAEGCIYARYDTPENLAPTDMQTVAWRRLLVEAAEREMPAELSSADLEPAVTNGHQSATTPSR
jgi:phenylpropionate dioxygenase-like ring-hydroxylating dioxygenase large terminal subunit